MGFHRDSYWVSGICLGLTILAAAAFAVTTMRSEIDDYETFKKGDYKTVSISSDGKILIAPSSTKLYDPDAEIVWGITVNGDYAWLATGNSGRVFKVELKSGKGTLVCDQPELEIYAITSSRDGSIYFAASPGGKIYRLRDRAEPEIFFETNEEYIWDLIFDPDGYIFAATGKEGKIYRISPQGKGEVWFDSPATNILTLALTPNRSLIAGSQGKAFIYRIEKKGEGYVLYAPELEEVKKILCLSDGTLYAAINGEQTPRGALMERIIKMLEAGAKTTDTDSSKTKAPSRAVQSEIIKVTPEGYVHKVCTPPDKPVHGMCYDSYSRLLYVTAGSEGLVYQINARGDHILAGKVDSKYIPCCVPDSGNILLGTGSPARIYRLNTDHYAEGEYSSFPLDTGSPVKWGNLELGYRTPEQSAIEYRYRAGNTPEPDANWTEWSKYRKVESALASIDTPVSRFLQVAVRMTSSRKERQGDMNVPLLDSSSLISERYVDYPSVDYIYAYYIESNAAPIIAEVTISTQKPQPPAPPQAARTPTPDAKPAQEKKNGDSKSTDKEPDSNPRILSITWKATDPNKDKLIYELYFKGEDEQEWKLVKDELEQPKYEISTVTLPDGKYRIKVVASDTPTNLERDTLKSEFISSVFTVDSTAPEISGLRVKRNGDNSITVSLTATDATSLIASARYSLDASGWKYLLPEDGLFDSNSEKISFTLADVAPGEHVISVIVTDAVGNTNSAKAVVK